MDYHYSDTWADPAKQFIPKAWEGKNPEELTREVYEYTKETMLTFHKAGVFPDMVQVGNEINNGMLWPIGKLPENWDNFAAKAYDKKIVVVEAAYNYALQEYKNKKAPFPETPEGQKEFLKAVNNIILSIPNDKGKGLFWWEPAAPNKGFSTRTFFKMTVMYYQ